MLGPYVGSVPQRVLLYVAFLGSMLAGASTVHYVLKPDLTLPPPPPPPPPPARAPPAALA